MKTGASYKKSGILLRDGAEIVVRDKENGSVVLKIRKNPVLRYRKWCTGVTGQEKTDYKHLLLQMCRIIIEIFLVLFCFYFVYLIKLGNRSKRWNSCPFIRIAAI